MKTIKLLAIGILFTVSSAMQAQILLNVNIGMRPVPVTTVVDYYYIPDAHAYYDARQSVYVYAAGNRWVRSRYLPAHYRNANISNRIALNGYRGAQPYQYYSNHREPQRVVYVENNHHYDKHDFKKYDKHYDKHNKKYKGKH